jgi:hypothetical protein
MKDSDPMVEWQALIAFVNSELRKWGHLLSVLFEEERLLNLSQATHNEIGQTEKMGATRSSEMLVHNQNTTRRNNPKD